MPQIAVIWKPVHFFLLLWMMSCIAFCASAFSSTHKIYWLMALLCSSTATHNFIMALNAELNLYLKFINTFWELSEKWLIEFRLPAPQFWTYSQTATSRIICIYVSAPKIAKSKIKIPSPSPADVPEIPLRSSNVFSVDCITVL